MIILRATSFLEEYKSDTKGNYSENLIGAHKLSSFKIRPVCLPDSLTHSYISIYTHTQIYINLLLKIDYINLNMHISN